MRDDMHTLINAAAAAALLAALPATAFAASKTFNVEPFTAIEISSGIDAKVTTGGTLSVVGEAPDDGQLNELKVEVSGGKLRAFVDWNLLGFLMPEKTLKLTITVPELHAANADSGASVEVAGVSGDVVSLGASSGANLSVTGAAGTRYEIESSSGAGLTVEGACETAMLEASSGANLGADKLLCQSVTAEASSGASADVFASARAKLEASSGANLDLAGKPASIEQDASSGASINIR
jgi:hypothetical protein